MRRFIAFFIFVLFAQLAVSQVRPDQFPDETDLTGVAFYTQEVDPDTGNPTPRKVTAETLRDQFATGVNATAVTYTPATAGNTQDLNSWVVDPAGDTWFIGKEGNAVNVSGLGVANIGNSDLTLPEDRVLAMDGNKLEFDGGALDVIVKDNGSIFVGTDALPGYITSSPSRAIVSTIGSSGLFWSKFDFLGFDFRNANNQQFSLISSGNFVQTTRFDPRIIFQKFGGTDIDNPQLFNAPTGNIFDVIGQTYDGTGYADRVGIKAEYNLLNLGFNTTGTDAFEVNNIFNSDGSISFSGYPNTRTDAPGATYRIWGTNTADGDMISIDPATLGGGGPGGIFDAANEGANKAVDVIAMNSTDLTFDGGVDVHIDESHGFNVGAAAPNSLVPADHWFFPGRLSFNGGTIQGGWSDAGLYTVGTEMYQRFNNTGLLIESQNQGIPAAASFVTHNGTNFSNLLNSAYVTPNAGIIGEFKFNIGKTGETQPTQLGIFQVRYEGFNGGADQSSFLMQAGDRSLKLYSDADHEIINGSGGSYKIKADKPATVGTYVQVVDQATGDASWDKTVSLGSDDQTLSKPAVNQIEIQDGNTVDIFPAPVNGNVLKASTGAVGWAQDGLISSVALNGTDLEFTGQGGAFNSTVPLATLGGGADNLGNQTSTSGNVNKISLTGGGAGFINAGLVLQATNSTNARGLGTYGFDQGGDNEWFWGRPYINSDRFVINRTTGNGAHTESTANGGNALMVLDNTGKLGLNTSPAYPLHMIHPGVSGDLAEFYLNQAPANPRLRIGGDQEGMYFNVVYSTGADALKFKIVGNEKMRLSGDYLGINATDPQHGLHLGQSRDLFIQGTDDPSVLFGHSDNSTSYSRIFRRSVADGNGSGGALVIENQQNVPVEIWSNSIKIASARNENFGVGEDNPSYKLHVNSGAANQNTMFESTDPHILFNMRDDATTSNEAFRRAGNDLMFLGHNNGNVSIGNYAPTEKLHVDGNVLIENDLKFVDGVNGGATTINETSHNAVFENGTNTGRLFTSASGYIIGMDSGAKLTGNTNNTQIEGGVKYSSKFVSLSTATQYPALSIPDFLKYTRIIIKDQTAAATLNSMGGTTIVASVYDGVVITVHNYSATETLTIESTGGTLPFGSFFLSAPIVLNPYDNQQFIYDSLLSGWVVF